MWLGTTTHGLKTRTRLRRRMLRRRCLLNQAVILLQRVTTWLLRQDRPYLQLTRTCHTVLMMLTKIMRMMMTMMMMTLMCFALLCKSITVHHVWFFFCLGVIFIYRCWQRMLVLSFVMLFTSNADCSRCLQCALYRLLPFTHSHKTVLVHGDS